VARCGHYPKPRKTARDKRSCYAGSCGIVQNEAGTCQQKWHKTDTSGSPSVHVTAGLEKQIAAPTGIGSGDNTIEKHGSAFEGNSYHNTKDAATRAGLWYAENRETCPRPVVPALRSIFGLSALEAVKAIREANGGGR
jgi:hypothetical protein